MLVSARHRDVSRAAGRFVRTISVASSNSFRRRAIAGSVLVAAALGLSACMGGSSSKPVPVALTDDATAKPLVKPVGNSSIPVLVNDVPITAYDINQRLRLMRLGGGKASDTAAREELIDETLEMLEAARQGVSVPPAQVDAAFASIGSRLKMSPAQLTKGLASQGIQASALRKRLEAQMAWQTLVARPTQQKASVKTEEVNAILSEKGDPTALTITEYTLQQIIFVVPSGSGAGVYAQRRSEAAAFRQRFPGCDQSLAKAKLLRGVVVKDIGRRDSTQLQGPDGDAIQKTAVGSTTPPQQTGQGIELVAVCASHSIQSASGARADAENTLYLKQAEGLGKDYLKELRDRAIIEYR
jgi:peptidyl-prolyl cis-trans isomerase SurA